MEWQIFVTEEKVLLIKLFSCAPNFFLICSTRAPKNKSKRRALFSECGGAYERLLWCGWVWGLEEKKIYIYNTQYTHNKKLDYTTWVGNRKSIPILESDI